MDYAEKFNRIKGETLFRKLNPAGQSAVRRIATENFLTLQELRKLVEYSLDLDMWGQVSLQQCWQAWRDESSLTGREFRKWAMSRLEDHMQTLRRTPVEYDPDPPRQRAYRPVKIRRRDDTAAQKIFGMCPVKSEKTLCCNLRTIDAVKNCGFGCSYCSIQTMYTDQNIVFDDKFAEKLAAINLDPQRYYHVGTGQSSDALMWGNKYNILEQLFGFARQWPRVLLEFKSKSDNVAYLLASEVPPNIVCSWSVNPDIVIRNEEHLTASLGRRLDAARAVADKGIRIAFHLHPMIHFNGWELEYERLIGRILSEFTPSEVVFISLGALTFPKPVLGKLRNYGIHSRINQTQLVPNPEGKLTYPDNIKVELFAHAYRSFSDWHGKVFFYLCMEEPRLWDLALGYRYPDNETMENRLLESAWSKLALHSAPGTAGPGTRPFNHHARV